MVIILYSLQHACGEAFSPMQGRRTLLIGVPSRQGAGKAACQALDQVLTCVGVQDVEIMRKVPGWRPKRAELAERVPSIGRLKGKNRNTACK